MRTTYHGADMRGNSDFLADGESQLRAHCRELQASLLEMERAMRKLRAEIRELREKADGRARGVASMKRTA